MKATQRAAIMDRIIHDDDDDDDDDDADDDDDDDDDIDSLYLMESSRENWRDIR